MTRTILDGFERGLLFRLTRFVAITAIILLAAVIVASGVALSLYLRSTSSAVTPDEIVVGLKTQRAESRDKAPVAPTPGLLESSDDSIKVPFILQKYLSTPQNMQTLKGWLSGLTADEKTNFLSELASVVVVAEKEKLDPIDAINKYRTIKLQRLAENKLKETQRSNYMFYFAGAIATGLVLISQLSLVLVLLAVERNTRQVAAS